MLKSSKANADNLSSTASHQLCEQKINKIRAAIEAVVYGAEMVSKTECMQFGVLLISAWQAATTWWDADRQKAIECFELDIHYVTPVKCWMFNELFQHHERQLFEEVETMATGCRSIFAQHHALMKTTVENNAYGVAKVTANKRLQFQNCLSDAESEATTWSLSETERVTDQLERVLYGITSNEQKQCNKKYSIRLIEYEAWWETIAIQALQKTIEKCVINFKYRKIHLLRHICEAINQIDTGDNCTTVICGRLHIANMKDRYRSCNKLSYIQQMVTHNDQCPGLDYMEETLLYLALQG